MAEKIRCSWCLKDQLYMDYHDFEWGIPEHDDQKLFEMIMLEGAQAGLSWYTVLVKRENYRRAFDGFDPDKMARYDEAKLATLREDAGIIRNKLKIQSAVTNAQAFLKVQEAWGSFDKFIWQFTDYQVIDNQPQTLADVPAKTPESDAMSKALKKEGFKFVGSTICYAFMQACGMVNDHVMDCWTRSRG
ncbi:MAG: DNA-3-methyladenine glycosylase I [Bacteroidota bacterium]